MDEVEVWHQAPSRGASRLIEQSARSRERYFNSGAEVWWQGILEISRGCHAGGLPTHSAFLFGSSHTCHLLTLSLRGLPLGVDCRFCSPKEDALQLKKSRLGSASFRLQGALQLKENHMDFGLCSVPTAKRFVLFDSSGFFFRQQFLSLADLFPTAKTLFSNTKKWSVFSLTTSRRFCVLSVLVAIELQTVSLRSSFFSLLEFSLHGPSAGVFIQYPRLQTHPRPDQRIANYSDCSACDSTAIASSF